jgi:glutamyl-tRNA reductase
MSVAFAAVKLAEQIFGRLRGRQALILGAGTVSEQVAAHLRDRGIAEIGVANRSQERAEDLARRVDGHAVAWDLPGRDLCRPDILVASVAATEPVLTRAMLEQAMAARGNRAMFVIDLGVPRNVESSAGNLYNLYLYNIDNLSEIVEQNRKAREQEIPRAEALVAEQVRKFQTWQAGMLLRSLTQELREKLQQVREEFLRERRTQMERLAAEERERFAKLTEQLIEQVLEEHSPPGSHAEARRRLQEIESLRESLGLARERQ